MQPLTERQQKILAFIQKFVSERGYPPTVREVARHFRIAVSSAQDHLDALKRKGAITRAESMSRSLSIVGSSSADLVDIPVVGRIAAGEPILAVENIESTMKLPSDMVSSGELFALRVRGDSMTGAGLQDGDYSIVRSQDSAEEGDIVVALLEDEATVKRFHREGRRIVLKAENPAYADREVRDARIVGKVVGLVRSLLQK